MKVVLGEVDFFVDSLKNIFTYVNYYNTFCLVNVHVFL